MCHKIKLSQPIHTFRELLSSGLSSMQRCADALHNRSLISNSALFNEKTVYIQYDLFLPNCNDKGQCILKQSKKNLAQLTIPECAEFIDSKQKKAKDRKVVIDVTDQHDSNKAQIYYVGKWFGRKSQIQDLFLHPFSIINVRSFDRGYDNQILSRLNRIRNTYNEFFRATDQFRQQMIHHDLGVAMEHLNNCRFFYPIDPQTQQLCQEMFSNIQRLTITQHAQPRQRTFVSDVSKDGARPRALTTSSSNNPPGYEELEEKISEQIFARKMNEVTKALEQATDLDKLRSKLGR